jgi:hypothetical protein
MKTKEQKISPTEQLLIDIDKLFKASYHANLSENIKRGIARKKLLGLKVNK